MIHDVHPCGNCGCRQATLSRRHGTTGRTPLTRTRWYRETITCNNCGISIQARSPGKAVLIWDQASKSRGALQKTTEEA